MSDPLHVVDIISTVAPRRPGPHPVRWTGAALRALVWSIGVAGFLVPLILARSSPHAGLLRAFALAWFVALGVVNAVIVLRRRRGAPS